MSDVRAKFTRESPQARRADLVMATRRCLAELGAAGTSVREIAARAGVSPGLIRHHFGSMDALVLETYRQVGQLVTASIDEAVEAAGPAPIDRLFAFLDANLRPPILDAELLGTWIGFWSLVRTDPAFHALHAALYGAGRLRLEALVAEAARQAGADVDSRRVALALTALIDGLWLEQCLDASTFSPGEAQALARQTALSLIGQPR